MCKNNTKVLVVSALLAAISIILSRFLVIQVGNSIRISFGNLPIFLAGFFFGPAVGMLVGAAADFVGATLLSGLGFNPILIIGPMLVGFCAGFTRQVLYREVNILRLSMAVFPVCLVSSILWMSFGLHLTFGQPFWFVLMTRMPISLSIAALEVVILNILFRSRVFAATNLWHPTKPQSLGDINNDTDAST